MHTCGDCEHSHSADMVLLHGKLLACLAYRGALPRRRRSPVTAGGFGRSRGPKTWFSSISRWAALRRQRRSAKSSSANPAASSLPCERRPALHSARAAGGAMRATAILWSRSGMSTRVPSKRKAMLRNMVSSLFEHERIETTLPKAKAALTAADKHYIRICK